MVQVPPAHTLVWPTLRAIRDLGGSATVSELTKAVVSLNSLSEDVQSAPHGSSASRTELEYRLAWARTYLKNIKAVENSARGVWSVTDLGREIDEAQVVVLMRQWRLRLAEQRAARAQAVQAAEEELELEGDDAATEDEASWEDALLSRMQQLAPDAFERLAKRILREAGFESVTVTGGTGDQGIDGLGMYRLSLVSFPVFFQCKRYSGPVRSPAVRDFRGAMQGRGDKGLLITTGTFTADAKAEATREGAPPIDLVDGQQLCRLLMDLRLGVQVTERTVQEVSLDEDFFAGL